MLQQYYNIKIMLMLSPLPTCYLQTTKYRSSRLTIWLQLQSRKQTQSNKKPIVWQLIWSCILHLIPLVPSFTSISQIKNQWMSYCCSILLFLSNIYKYISIEYLLRDLILRGGCRHEEQSFNLDHESTVNISIFCLQNKYFSPT